MLLRAARRELFIAGLRSRCGANAIDGGTHLARAALVLGLGMLGMVAAGRAQEQSLACYLPDNLDELAYVPLGMEEAVENFRNRARKGKKRLPQES